MVEYIKSRVNFHAKNENGELVSLKSIANLKNI